MSSILGQPWAWGCKRIVSVPADWKCPGCGAKSVKRNPVALERLDGQLLCGDCARQLWEEAS